MGEERLAALTLTHIHADVDVTVKEVVNRFIQIHPRRLFKQSILFD